MADQVPSFPAAVELVTVDVVVTDKEGEPVTGLAREDFSLLEDDSPQEITSFEAVELPAEPSPPPASRPRVSTNVRGRTEPWTGRFFGIVFDDIQLTPFQATRAKNAVAEFLSKGVRSGDRVSLVATGGGAWWSTRMPGGRDELMTLLSRLEGRRAPERGLDRLSDYEAMRIYLFGDPQVQNRVERRFRSYGAIPEGGRYEQGTTSTNPYRSDVDPLVHGRASEVYTQAAARNRLTLQVVERLAGSLEGIRGRKSVILVSPGFIYDTHLTEFRRVVEACRRSNVVIYSLDTRGLQGLPTHFEAEFGPALDTQDLGAAFIEGLEAAAGSEHIALDSGGLVIKNTNDLAEGIQRIADESRAYYLLGYLPRNTTRDGKFRDIEVEVSRKGLRVRARKGYYAPLEGETVQARRPGEADPKIQRAVDSPFDIEDVPLRIASYVFEETLLGKARVRLATEASIRDFAFREEDDRSLDTLDFLAVVTHRNSGEVFQYDQQVDMRLRGATRERLEESWFPVIQDFQLAPGGYQAKVVVRDRNGGRIGSVFHEFEVPDLTSFRASTPVLGDTLEPSREWAQGPPRPLLLARRTFPAGATLYLQYDVYGAARDEATGMPRVRAGYEIRRSDGSLALRAPASVIAPTSLGHLSRLSRAPLPGAEPGEYELVLTLVDEVAGQTLEVREPFALTSAGAD